MTPIDLNPLTTWPSSPPNHRANRAKYKDRHTFYSVSMYELLLVECTESTRLQKPFALGSLKTDSESSEELEETASARLIHVGRRLPAAERRR